MTIKILHCINDLIPAGAEFALKRLIVNSNANDLQHAVIVLTGLNEGQNILSDLDIPVYQLHLNRRLPSPFALLKIKQIIREEKPDLLHTWLYAGILAGSLAAWKSGIPIVWGLHHADLDPQHQKKMTAWTMKACARLSHSIPTTIIACGESVRQNHIAFRFDAKKIVVIPNGIDTKLFKPDPSAPAELKKELGLDNEVKLVGIASRFHPIKDHANFLQAAAIVAEQRADIHFVLCGNEITSENAALVQIIRQSGLENKCHLLGRRKDMPKILAAWDVAVSSSRSEALSNALIEAMACGTPCVATDVGDTAFIIGDFGVTVPAQNAEKLAGGILKLMTLEPEALHAVKQGTRKRIISNFDMRIISAETGKLYKKILENS